MAGETAWWGKWDVLSDPGSVADAGLTRLDSAAHGLRFANTLSDAAAQTNRILENGSGVAAGDVNGDGRCDVYFATLEGPNHLYLNLGNWVFEEVPQAGGAACEDQASTGVLLVDLDGDQDLDLLVNGLATGTRLWWNDGQGRFQEAADPGLRSSGGPTSMGVADADGDGDLDLYVTDYREVTWKDLPPGIAPRVVMADGKPKALPVERFLAVDRGQGVKPGIIELGLPDHFYVNTGQGLFEEQSWVTGRFLSDTGVPLSEAPRHWGLSVMFRDLNGDLLPDLFVCNDFADGADQCWINQGQGVFKQISNLNMRQSSWSSMAVDVADINRDGLDDFLVVEMLSRKHSLRMTQRANEETGRKPPEMAMKLDRPQTQRNTLFVARGDGSYAELARMLGLDASEWSWGVAFLDLDLDGFEDVLVCNGNNHDLLDGDATMDAVMAMRSAPRGQVPRTLLMYPSLNLANLAFRNNGSDGFEAISQQWGFDERGISQGIALADLDGDGDQDVLLNNLQSGPGLYRNESSRPRIQVVLKGQPPNTAAIGARVSLIPGQVGSWPTQSTVLVAGGRYLSSDMPSKTFALPEQESDFRLQVIWPSGRETVVDNIRSGRRYQIEEVSSGDVASAVKPQDHLIAQKTPSPRPRLVQLSLPNDSRMHQETDSDQLLEWQPLIPRFIGRSGVCLQAADLNGDDRMDLILGQGDGYPSRVLLQDTEGSGFAASLELPGSGLGDATDLAHWIGVEGVPRMALSMGNAHQRLLAGGDPRSQPAVMIYEMDGGFPRLIQSLTGQLASPSCLELLDADSDGDLDLFVGGGFHAGQYGQAATSRLYRNDSGEFHLDLETSRTWVGTGMVTDAVALDWDLDGDSDLVLSQEWGSLQLWENRNGVFVNRSQETGLRSRHGWWMTLAAGDLDGDGDSDLVTGNWGMNTDYQKHLHHPIRLYHGDLDANGTYDVVESYYAHELEDWVPASDLVALGNVFGFVRERYRRYASVSQLTMKRLFEDVHPLDQWLEIHSLESGIWWNQGDHFTWQSLPDQAQWSPVMSLALADWNQDGKLDIFLGQNFQSPKSAISRMDAGEGLLLENLGAGHFRCLPSWESGIKLYGEQSASLATDWNGDGRMDLVVGQTADLVEWFLCSPDFSDDSQE